MAAKGLDNDAPVNPLFNLKKPKIEKVEVQGTNNKNNPEPKSKPANKGTTKNKNNNNNSTKRSTKNNNSTSTVTVKEKIKYTETKTQRAYWLDNDLVEIFDREYPVRKYDKSDIMNQLLRNFLAENNKI